MTLKYLSSSNGETKSKAKKSSLKISAKSWEMMNKALDSMVISCILYIFSYICCSSLFLIEKYLNLVYNL